ncbi:hypothetical protein [Streptomyces xanthochromogenes]|uniref:hypothetical protein n=1 Tax=Streptomyces xanthochromogenes TaxID=67384 RepID=UPI00382392E6
MTGVQADDHSAHIEMAVNDEKKAYDVGKKQRQGIGGTICIAYTAGLPAALVTAAPAGAVAGAPAADSTGRAVARAPMRPRPAPVRVDAARRIIPTTLRPRALRPGTQDFLLRSPLAAKPYCCW